MGPELLADIGQTFKDTANSGPLALGMVVAALAGLVSFLSPCVLPLVPGYLSYMTGLSGADLADEESGGGAHRWRVVVGGTLFVLGFALVFVSYGLLFSKLGDLLIGERSTVTRVLGGVTILMGLAFAGLLPLPFLQREARLHKLPAAGLAGAPLLGVVFGLGWTPCIGPTLAAVLALGATTETAGRGALLTFTYCIGLGAPFVVSGLLFRRALKAFAVVKRHYQLVTRIGGAMLVVVGVLQVTGTWERFTIWLVTHYSGFTPSV